MTRSMLAALSAAALLASSALTFAAEDTAAANAKMTDDQIRDHLAAQGYTVKRVTHDGDKINIYATDRQGAPAKLLVDAQTGKVSQAADDDDDDDD